MFVSFFYDPKKDGLGACARLKLFERFWSGDVIKIASGALMFDVFSVFLHDRMLSIDRLYLYSGLFADRMYILFECF